MSQAHGIPLFVWLSVWKFWQAYHRYTVEGIDRLDGEASLIVGYHGRPLAFDMCMLTVALYDRLGYLPHGIVHRGVEGSLMLKWYAEGLGFVTGDGAAITAAVRRGEHIVTTPGGGLEGCRSFRQRYQVRWGNHTGYVRLALRHGLKIVPVAAAGADDTYFGLNDAEACGRMLWLPSEWRWLTWVGLGPLGVYPYSPPFPVRLRQIVGEPIDPRADGAIDPRDKRAVGRIHERVVAAVQDLLDRARGL